MKRIGLYLTGCFAVQAAVAGVYVETVDHDLKAGTTKVSQKMYVQSGNGRFVDEDGRATIIKGETMYIVDDADKSYVVFDKATMEQLAKKINDATAQAKEQLAKLPPEQRAQVEALMAAQMPGLLGEPQKFTVDAIDTGKADKVDGRACKVWDVKRNDQLDEQLCVVPYSSLPGKENLPAVFAKFAKVFEEMAKSVPMLQGMMTDEFSALTKVNGYPVRTRGYERGKLGDSETLVKVWREENVPAAMFEIPAGYKQKQME